MDIFHSIYSIHFHGRSGKGQFPVFVPFIKKFKVLSGTIYIFPPLSICPELCTWPPPASREVEEVIPAMEVGMEEGLGNEYWVSWLIVSTIDATDSL